MRLVSGPTIRPLLDYARRKAPAARARVTSSSLYGVPRSDYQTVITGSDIDDYGLTGAEVNQFRADVMLYAPLVPRRETPYGLPPVERALLPIISGLAEAGIPAFATSLRARSPRSTSPPATRI